MKKLLHREALDALLHVATSPRRFDSRSAIVTQARTHPSTVSNAISGRRPLPDGVGEAIADVLGIDAEALWVPLPAAPVDWRVQEELRALEAWDRANRERFDELYSAIVARAKGD